jgi:hypothetical protein
MKHTKLGWLPKRTTLVGESFTIIAILLFMGLVFHTLAPRASLQFQPAHGDIEFATYLPPGSTKGNEIVHRTKPACDIKNLETVASQNDVICLIHQYANQYGIEADIALRVAEAESQYGKYNHNLQGSSAKGIYMFTDGTWDYTGGGDVLNPETNIERFMIYFKSNPEWWDASKHKWYEPSI